MSVGRRRSRRSVRRAPSLSCHRLSRADVGQLVVLPVTPGVFDRVSSGAYAGRYSISIWSPIRPWARLFAATRSRRYRREAKRLPDQESILKIEQLTATHVEEASAVEYAAQLQRGALMVCRNEMISDA
jgi:hypothetical protein